MHGLTYSSMHGLCVIFKGDQIFLVSKLYLEFEESTFCSSLF